MMCFHNGCQHLCNSIAIILALDVCGFLEFGVQVGKYGEKLVVFHFRIFRIVNEMVSDSNLQINQYMGSRGLIFYKMF